jgi:hypothetical protein
VRRLIAAAVAMFLLTGCARGMLDWTDNSGVERHPDSRAPDPHTGH